MFEFIALSFFDARYIWLLLLLPLCYVVVCCLRSRSPAQDCAGNFYNVETSRTIHNKNSISMLSGYTANKTARKTYGINVCNSLQHPIKTILLSFFPHVIDKVNLDDYLRINMYLSSFPIQSSTLLLN